MILTCPSCATRYLIDPAVLPPGGRAVRCAKCSHTWHEEPPPDAPKRVDLEPPPVVRPLPPGSNLPAVPERARGSMVGWLVVLLFIAAVVAGGFYGRQKIVDLWPPAARIYGQLGLPVKTQPKFGLVLRNLSSSTQIENGAAVLTIVGEVANVIDEPRPAPKLRIVLRDAQKKELKDWVHAVEGSEIKAGEKASFTVRLREPPTDARDLEVTFVMDTAS